MTLMLMLGTAFSASPQTIWIETSAADFADGTYDNTEVVSDDVLAFLKRKPRKRR